MPSNLQPPIQYSVSQINDICLARQCFWKSIISLALVKTIIPTYRFSEVEWYNLHAVSTGRNTRPQIEPTILLYVFHAGRTEYNGKYNDSNREKSKYSAHSIAVFHEKSVVHFWTSIGAAQNDNVKKKPSVACISGTHPELPETQDSSIFNENKYVPGVASNQQNSGNWEVLGKVVQISFVIKPRRKTRIAVLIINF